MSDSDRIDRLFLRWLELRRLGRPASAAELCGDRPDLVPELEQRIRMAELLAGPRPVTPPPAAGPPTLPGFDFHHPLGRGAFGEVWLATDRSFRQKRAVKVLHPDVP